MPDLAASDSGFSVAATGADPLNYQWRKNKTALLSSNAPTLTLNSARFADSGGYSVIVSNPLGSVVSAEAALSVLPPVIESFRLGSNGVRQFQMNWAHSNTVIEASSNFANWRQLPGVGWTTNSVDAQDPQTNAPMQFYRTKLP